MRKLSLLLAIVMIVFSLSFATHAEESANGPRFTSYDQVNELISILPTDGEQAELGYLKGLTAILEVDGFQFKDLNKNAQLDVYEDWRQDVEARVRDLYDQMTLEEKAGLFFI